MNKVARFVAFFVVALFLAPLAVFAADPAAVVAAPVAPIDLSAIAASLILIAAAWGIGQIGSHAVDSMARQPEAAGNIQTAMIISEALIEGVAFFALIICLMK